MTLSQKWGLKKLSDVFFERKLFKSQTENLEHDFQEANVSMYETLEHLNSSAVNEKWKKQTKMGGQIQRDVPPGIIYSRKQEQTAQTQKQKAPKSLCPFHEIQSLKPSTKLKQHEKMHIMFSRKNRIYNEVSCELSTFAPPYWTIPTRKHTDFIIDQLMKHPLTHTCTSSPKSFLCSLLQ